MSFDTRFGLSKTFLKTALKTVLKVIPVFALVASVLAVASPAHANVSDLKLYRRSCASVTAFVTYDSYSEGLPAFYAVFAVDPTGQGVFGQAYEPIKFVRVTPGGAQSYRVTAQIYFDAVPEGSTISVTSYEVDSAGVPVSKQLPPVSYQCSHRPDYSVIPANPGVAVPAVGVVAKITTDAVSVYSGASAQSTQLGGLGSGESATVVALNRRGDWAEVDFEDQTGWIMWKTQAILFGPYAALPVLPNYEDNSANTTGK